MGAEVIILFNPYTYNFLKGLTHSALQLHVSGTKSGGKAKVLELIILPELVDFSFWEVCST